MKNHASKVKFDWELQTSDQAFEVKFGKTSKKKKKKIKASSMFDETRPLLYQEQLNHPNWHFVRRKVLKRDGFKCKRCSGKKNLQVHHKKYFGKYAWETPVKHLETLCKDCHLKEHGKRL